MTTLRSSFAFFLLALSVVFCAAGASPSGIAEAGAWRMRGLADIDKGNPVEADSLLCLADSAGALAAADLLRWIEVKAVLAKYNDAARLCCTIAAREPRMRGVACGRFEQALQDQALAVKRGALNAYRGCALSAPDCDTLWVKQWLSRTLASFTLYAQQDSLLMQLDTKSYPSGQDFFESAQQRFSQGFMADAVFPATQAFLRLDSASDKSLAATMLFHWYRQALKTDSASLWLARASLSDERFKIAAIAFLQSAGMIDKADSLRKTLRPSLSRDTLEIRRLLFVQDPKSASARAGGLGNYRDAAVIWKMRSAIFGGNSDEIIGWIDTVSFSPATAYGEEILAYRYRLEMLASEPAAMHDFCVLSYALWLGKTHRATALKLSSYPRAIRELFVCDIVKAFDRSNRFAEAQAAATALGMDSAGPELRYYYADVLIKQGFRDQGASELERLLLAAPGDVFGARARLLLASLKRKR